MPRVLLCLSAFVLCFALGCQGGGAYDGGPPEGWTAEGDRWWRPGADTTIVFRDLATLRAMAAAGSEVTYVAAPQMSRAMQQAQAAHAVKRSMIKLYRNQPEVVDSLFEQLVRPRMEAEAISGDLGDYVERFRQEGVKLIRGHFREPRQAKQLGRDIEVVFPDSLRRAGVGGRVEMQVYLDDEGRPQAIELLEGVHPVLDDLAMRATTEMEWAPAYLIRRGNWRGIPSWVRFNINYRTS